MEGHNPPVERPQYQDPFFSREVKERHPLSKYQSYNTQPPPAGTAPIRRTLPRTISSANLELTNISKDIVKRDFVREAPHGGTNFFSTTPMFTLTIPSLDNLADLKSYVLSVLVDSSVQKSLEDEHIINWCSLVTKVVPLRTVGDGNCLLHAASLGMWGFQDRHCTLRNALYDSLQCQTENTLYERWKQSREVENDRIGLLLTPDLWEKEWQCVKNQATTDIVIGQNSDGLDDFHVFVLANVLRRPIIMYASSKYRSTRGAGSLQKLDFEGVYLPLLWHASLCKRSPLPLAFCNGHFSSLTVVESPDQYKTGHLVLPLVDSYGHHLPVKFAMAMEDKSTLCMEYLDLIQKRINEGSPAISCSKLTVLDKSDNFVKSLASAFVSSCAKAFEQENNIRNGWESNSPSNCSGDGKGLGYQGERRDTILEGMHHCKNACGNYGEAKYSHFCFECYQERELVSSQGALVPRSAIQQPRSRSQPQMGNQNLLDLDNDRQLKSRTYNQAGSDRRRGTLKCSECSEPGYPQFLGRCRRCYNRTQSADGNTIYETLPPAICGSPTSEKAPSVPLPRNLKKKSLCRKIGCTFYGTEECRFYCSKCFDSNLQSILKEADQEPPISGVSPILSTPAHLDPREGGWSGTSSANNPPKCSNCYLYFASEEYKGLCHECFLKSTLPSGGSSLASSGVNCLAFNEPHHSNSRDVGGGAQKIRSGGSYDCPMYASQPSRVQSLHSSKVGGHRHAECIMCNGKDDLLGSQSETFLICKRHAIEALRGQTQNSFHEGSDRPLEHRGGSGEQGRRGSAEQGRRGSAEQGWRGSAEQGRRDSAEQGWRGNAEQGWRGSAEQGWRGGAEQGWRGGAEQGWRGSAEQGRSGRDSGDVYHDTPDDPQQFSRAHQDGNNPRRLPTDDGHNDEAGGSSGTFVRSGGDDYVMEKSLCTQPGCSYLPYKELRGNCPYCYEDVFEVSVDYKKFPPI